MWYKLRLKHALYLVPFLLLGQISCGDLTRIVQVRPLPPVIIASDRQVATLQVMPNRYIVLFKSQPGLDQVKFTSYHAETSYFSGFVNSMYQFDSGIEEIRLISAVKMPNTQTSSPFTALNWQHEQPVQVGLITEVSFASNKLAAAYINHWHQQGGIYFAEPVYVSRLTQTSPTEGEETAPEDIPPPVGNEGPEEGTLAHLAGKYKEYETSSGFWWHKSIRLADALECVAHSAGQDKIQCPNTQILSQGKIRSAPTEVIIAVFDSGIDYEHEALKDRMYVRPDGNRVDWGCGLEDTNGCNTTIREKERLGDKRSYPWQAKDKAGEGKPCPQGQDAGYESCRHGTHVAGIIAADGTKTNGKAAGVCPFCRILNVRVLAGIPDPENSTTGGVSDSSILNGLKYVDQALSSNLNIRVINASIGKFHRSRSVSLMVSNLKHRDGGGVLVVGAAGNEDTMARTYPAALDDVLAVAAIDSNNKKSPFSNFGMWVDIAAPGGGRGNAEEKKNSISSTTPGNNYRGDAGTSMATPVVAGAAGLFLAVWASSDTITAEQLQVDYLQASSDFDLLYPATGDNTYNHTHYYTKIDRVVDRVPLLGVGAINVYNLLISKMDNREYVLKIYNEEDPRVDWVSCGVVREASASVLLLALLVVPLILLVVKRRVH